MTVIEIKALNTIKMKYCQSLDMIFQVDLLSLYDTSIMIPSP